MTRVVRLTPSQLHLRSRPSAWVIIGLWVGFLAMVVFTLPEEHLRAQRTGPSQATVTRRYHLLGVPLASSTVSGVTGATVLAKKPSDRRVQPHEATGVHTHVATTTYRVALLTTQGPVELGNGYTLNRSELAATVTQVEKFLQDGRRKTADVTVSPSIWMWAASAFLAFCAVGATFGAWGECLLDRDLDRVRITHPGLLGANTRDYALSDVERFKIVQTENRDRESSERYPMYFSLGMRLRSGIEISITRQQSTDVSDRDQDLLRVLELFRKGGLQPGHQAHQE